MNDGNWLSNIYDQYGKAAGDFQMEAAVDSVVGDEPFVGVRQILAIEELFDVDMKGVGV